RSCCD
ncbi:hypothetical protein AVEN_111202-1, partial [Araneus ventricosus]